MGPASSREQIGEQIGEDDGLHIHPKPMIVANNIVSISFLITLLRRRFMLKVGTINLTHFFH